jgi:copper homeostasis protein (lipoprotein)
MNHINYQKGNILPAVIIVIVGIMLIGSFWLVKGRHTTTPTASATPTPSAQASTSIQSSPSASPDNAAASSYKWGTFSGTMPCGDCSGITTTLALSSAGPGIDMGAYTMTMVYQGKSVEPFISKGDWTVNRGMPGNANATVIVLDETGSNQQQPQYFLRVGEDKLQMLDADQKPLPASLPST